MNRAAQTRNFKLDHVANFVKTGTPHKAIANTLRTNSYLTDPPFADL